MCNKCELKYINGHGIIMYVICITHNMYEDYEPTLTRQLPRIFGGHRLCSNQQTKISTTENGIKIFLLRNVNVQYILYM